MSSSSWTEEQKASYTKGVDAIVLENATRVQEVNNDCTDKLAEFIKRAHANTAFQPKFKVGDFVTCKLPGTNPKRVGIVTKAQVSCSATRLSPVETIDVEYPKNFPERSGLVADSSYYNRAKPTYQPGDKVRHKSGAFAGTLKGAQEAEVVSTTWSWSRFLQKEDGSEARALFGEHVTLKSSTHPNASEEYALDYLVPAPPVVESLVGKTVRTPAGNLCVVLEHNTVLQKDRLWFRISKAAVWRPVEGLTLFTACHGGPAFEIGDPVIVTGPECKNVAEGTKGRVLAIQALPDIDGHPIQVLFESSNIGTRTLWCKPESLHIDVDTLAGNKPKAPAPEPKLPADFTHGPIFQKVVDAAAKKAVEQIKKDEAKEIGEQIKKDEADTKQWVDQRNTDFYALLNKEIRANLKRISLSEINLTREWYPTWYPNYLKNCLSACPCGDPKCKIKVGK